MSLLVYHFAIPNFTAHVGVYRQSRRRSMDLLGLLFSGASLTDSTTQKENLPDILLSHFLANFSAPCWLAMPVSPSPNWPTGLLFLPFAYFPIMRVYIAN